MCFFKNDKQMEQMANAIRFLSADAIEKSKSGHPGMPLGMADVATVLFSRFIKLAPEHQKLSSAGRKNSRASGIRTSGRN